jgi:hypothetical protein
MVRELGFPSYTLEWMLGLEMELEMVLLWALALECLAYTTALVMVEVLGLTRALLSAFSLGTVKVWRLVHKMVMLWATSWALELDFPVCTLVSLLALASAVLSEKTLESEWAGQVCSLGLEKGL